MEIDKILLDEIRANRIAIAKLTQSNNEKFAELVRSQAKTREELVIFKAKAFGFMTLLGFVINGAIALFRHK